MVTQFVFDTMTLTILWYVVKQFQCLNYSTRLLRIVNVYNLFETAQIYGCFLIDVYLHLK